MILTTDLSVRSFPVKMVSIFAGTVSVSQFCERLILTPAQAVDATRSAIAEWSAFRLHFTSKVCFTGH